MNIFEIDNIESEYELKIAPNFFRTQEKGSSQNTIVEHRHQHKKRNHKPQHPSTYLTPWGYFYNANITGIHGHAHCLNVRHPCTYIPMLMLTQCGVLICLFVTVYSLCVSSKPKTHRSIDSYATQV